MNIFVEYIDRVIEALQALSGEGVLPSGLDFARVSVEPPRDQELVKGDTYSQG